ncbi:MAG: O-antigen ligase family protein [Candidatus Omnitrophica bacterium]|nr:O-antigen ligase family protein [Candidatus Omnitrophota bacterium]
MIFPLLFFITANNIKNLKQIKWLVGAMVLSMFIMDYYTGNQIKWMPGLISRTKIHGTFVWLGPNEVASFYAAYSFVILGILFFDTNKIRRLFFSITICLNMYCMLFLYSRGAYLGTFVGAVLISFIKNKKFLILLIMVAMFWQVILPSTVIDRINETKTEEGTFDNSIENRLTMWEQSIKLFNENPIFGVGFNVIPFLGLRLGDTHNVYVKILTEQGLVGVIIFVCFLILAIKEGWKLYGKADDNFLKGLGLGFVACSLSLIITNFFGDRWTYLQVGTYFWVFLGLVVRGNLITQEEKVLTNSSQTTKRL